MKKRGFTIVELVIVIAVIGILSAILIPTFANLTTRAQENALQTNLRNAYYAYSVEYADSGELVAESDVILSDVDTLVADGEAYRLNSADGKWVKQTITVSSGYELSLLDADAFNGFYVYAIVESVAP